jgi:excisionase family DNA binding protein
MRKAFHRHSSLGAITHQAVLGSGVERRQLEAVRKRKRPEPLGSTGLSRERRKGFEPSTPSLGKGSWVLSHVVTPSQAFVIPTDSSVSNSQRIAEPTRFRTPFAAKFAANHGTARQIGNSSQSVDVKGKGRLLTVRELAAKLRVSRATAYALCERGELPHVRISNAIRVALDDVEEFLRKHRRTERGRRRVRLERDPSHGE